MTDRRRFVAASLAALLVVSAVAGAAATPVAAAEDPAFEESSVSAKQNGTAEISIVVDSADPVDVAVGSEEDGFLATATVVDADGDGTVTLQVDVAEAGKPGSDGGAPYLAVSDGDELRDATQESEEIEPPLDPGTYDLTLGPSDDPYDVGALVVHEPDADTGSSGETDESYSEDDTREPVGPEAANGTTLDYDGDALVLTNETDRTVEGETELEPGTELQVRLTIEEDANGTPHLSEEYVTVDEDGTFAATFDLNGVAADATGEVTVTADGTTLATADLTVSGDAAGQNGDGGTDDGSSEDGDTGDDGNDGDDEASFPTVPAVIAGGAVVLGGAAVAYRLR